MKTFAQIVDGHAQNVVYGAESLAALASSFAPDFVLREIDAGRPWVLVPDGTKPNDTTDGKGNWTAAEEVGVEVGPASPAPPDAVSARLDRVEAVLGKIAAKLNTEE
ncbi:MAG: hypothetical protein WCP82_07275 [Alphaproteobacteria bacterium]